MMVFVFPLVFFASPCRLYRHPHAHSGKLRGAILSGIQDLPAWPLLGSESTLQDLKESFQEAPRSLVLRRYRTIQLTAHVAKLMISQYQSNWHSWVALMFLRTEILRLHERFECGGGWGLERTLNAWVIQQDWRKMLPLTFFEFLCWIVHVVVLNPKW